MNQDAFRQVAEALRHRWQMDRDAWTDAASANRIRNLLLDACGSDHRALVELVLVTGDELRTTLSSEHRPQTSRDSAHAPAPSHASAFASSPQSSAPDLARADAAGPSGASPTHASGPGGPPATRAWETQRAPMVHRLVATRFLQTDIARWLVDTWAYALGITAQVPTSPALESAVDASSLTTSAPPSASRGLIARVGKRGTAGTPGVGFRGPVQVSPSPRMAGPMSTLGHGAAMPMGRTRLTAADLARIKRMERLGFFLLAGAGAFAMLARGYAMWLRPLERERLAAATAAESPAPSATWAAATVTAGDLATPESVSGPTVSGVSGNETELPGESVNGLSGAIAQRTPDATIAARRDEAGHGGRYRVSHRATSVTGGDGCDVVEGALARQQTSVETFEHEVGSSALRLASRRLTGAVQPDGQFQLGPDSGTTDGVRWTFVMRGRFTSTGFVAQSQKTTEAIMKWHDTRSCAVVAELVGTRVAP